MKVDSGRAGLKPCRSNVWRMEQDVVPDAECRRDCTDLSFSASRFSVYHSYLGIACRVVVVVGRRSFRYKYSIILFLINNRIIINYYHIDK